MRPATGRLAFALTAWGLLAPAMNAQTVTIPAAADTYLRQSSANKNQGLETVLHVQQSGHNRALVRMDPALIAAAVATGSLASATLELYVSNSGGWGSDGRAVDLHRLTAAWTELGATWSCPDDTNPLNSQANCATQWDGGTFDPEASDSVLHTNPTAGYVQFNVTEDVRSFLTGTPNYGWLAKLSDETLGGNADYVSRQGSLLHAPRLVLVVESPLFDQVPPSLAITSPAHSVLINETTPRIGISYGDGGSGVALSSLSVKVDGVAAACTPAATSATCLPSTLGEGSHTITASVRDQAGNTATASRAFTLLIGPGRRSTTFPVMGDTYLRQGDANGNFGDETTLRVRQSGKNRSLARFDVAEIRQSVGQGTLVSASLELTIAKNGKNWSKTGRTVDAHRLTADWTEAGATWNCGIDTQPANNQPDCSPQWAGGTFQSTPTASVPHTNTLAGTVSFDVTADVSSLLGGASSYGWLVKKREENLSGLVDYASREAGAANAPRLVVVFDVPAGNQDTTPPSLAITAPAGTIYNSSTPQISVQYSDTQSGVDPASLIVQVDGVAVAGCQAGAASATCAAPQLAAGAHTIAAEVRDRAGNRATASGSFTIQTDLDGPELALLAPTEGTLYNVTSLQVEVSYSDAGSGLDLSSFAATLDDTPLACTAQAAGAICAASGVAAGDHTISARIQDRAGNVASAAVELTTVLDTTAPAVRFVAPAGSQVEQGALPEIQVAFSESGSGADAVSFHLTVDGAPVESCAIGLASALCPAPPLAEGDHTLAAEVRDRAGNLGSATLALRVLPERVPPTIAIVAPAEATIEGALLSVVVTYSDAGSGIDPASLAVTVDGAPLSCPAGADGATCEPRAFPSGRHQIVAAVADRKGNRASASREIELSVALAVAVTSPEPGMVTREQTVSLAGTVSPAATSVRVGEVEATVSGGSWTAGPLPLREGSNALTVVARSPAGGVGSATITVVRDTEAPQVAILSPRDGFVTSLAQVAVSGDLLDSTSSSAVQRPPTVLVNGQAPALERKSFVLADLLLVPGDNRIEVTAEDAAGNVGRSAITVRYVADAAARIEKISGDLQEAPARGTLPEPLLVRVVDFQGRPLAGRTVDFAVTRGDGALISFPDAARKLAVATDAAGLATVQLALGTRAGAGNQEVTASSLGIPGAVVFCATARTKPVKRLVPLVGTDFQGARRAAAGQALPKPLLVQAFDEFGNPVPGVAVTYHVAAGGGGFAGAADLTLATDEEGKTAAVFTLGPDEGINNNQVEVTFDGNAEPPVRFTVSGLVPGPAEATSISGVLLDPQDDPVPGAVMSVGALTTRTGADGRFHLAGVPVGTVHLGIDGTTVTRPGTWPHLGYEMVMVPGRDNDLGKPLRLPRVDDGGKVWVGGDQDVVVPMRGVAGASLTVLAHSATFPDGSHEGWVSFTQVPTFKVPMTAPMGSNFQLAWTLQPAGILFNPPARVTLPNFNNGNRGGAPPGSVLEVFSFDHDLEEFVSAGTASVSEDGRQLVSNPGMGIAKAGWGGAPPPPPPPAQGCGGGECHVCPASGPPVERCDSCSVCGGGGGAGAKAGSCAPKEAGTVQISRGIRASDVVVGVGQVFELTATVYNGKCSGYSYLWKRSDTGESLGSGQKIPLHFTKPELVPIEVAAQCLDCRRLDPIADGIVVAVVKILIYDVRTPSRQAAPPSEQGSFVAPADEILARAQVLGKPDLENRVAWEATPLNGHTGPANPHTADNTAEYRFHGDSNQPTTGSRSPNDMLGYMLKARLKIDGELVNEAEIEPPIPRVEQDETDIIRQEYVDYGTVFRPTRGLVSMATNPLFNTGNYTLIAEETRGNLQSLLDSVGGGVQTRLNNDVQEVPVGVDHLPPGRVVVSPGAAIRGVGALGDTDPEGDDVCAAPRGAFCNGAILAGPNGIAETHANNRHAAFAIGNAISSAYRNPQRNRAAGSVTVDSRHTRGRALDINPGRTPVAGKTAVEMMCLLEEAGDAVADAFAEIGHNQVPCTNTGADHVHVQN